MRRLILLFACLAAVASVVVAARSHSAGADQSGTSYDVVVYGATPSGVMAAVQASRQGKTTAIVEPSHYIGGMVTGGLSHTDIGSSPSVISGLTREYFGRIAATYGKTDAWDFEPATALRVMQSMLDEAHVPVFTDHPLDRFGTGVSKDGTAITAIATTPGDVFRGKQFVDASYEGDLMAAAGVTYTSGRESSKQYGESAAGVRPFNAQLSPPMAAYDANGRLYPEIDPTPLPAVGSADNHVQAYNYRVTSTTKASNRVPYPMPAGYDSRRYAALAAWLPLRQSALGRALKATDVLTMTALPNSKFDTNNGGPFSTDFLNGSFTYSDATDQQRAAVAEQTKTYDEGLLYFLQNDASVPAALHNDFARYGLAKDEFVGNGNWPTQLYVREARRMVGAYVLRQQDLQSGALRADGVAQGSYRIDEHNSFRSVDSAGTVRNEGSFSLPSKSPYPIPYSIITPRPGEASNLLVTGALSTTHVAWSSIRMEPQFMMLGQAAGDAAALAIDGSTSVQDVPVAALRATLQQQNVVLPALPGSTGTATPTPSASPSITSSSTPPPADSSPSSTSTPATPGSESPSTSSPSPVAAVLIDNTDPGFTVTGAWALSNATGGFYGSDYVHNNNAADGRTASWYTTLAATGGTWTVNVRWTAATNRSSAATYTICDGSAVLGTKTLSQRANGGVWVPLGSFTFPTGHPKISVTAAKATGYVIADAVQLTP